MQIHPNSKYRSFWKWLTSCNFSLSVWTREIAEIQHSSVEKVRSFTKGFQCRMLSRHASNASNASKVRMCSMCYLNLFDPTSWEGSHLSTVWCASASLFCLSFFPFFSFLLSGFSPGPVSVTKSQFGKAVWTARTAKCKSLPVASVLSGVVDSCVLCGGAVLDRW